MKNRKIILSILTVVLLLPMLVLPASALGEIEVAEGLESLIYNGDTFVRVDSADIYSVNDTVTVYNVSFSDADADAIVSAIAHANDSAIELCVDYELGGSGIYYYIRSDLVNEYRKAFLEGCNKCEINFDLEAYRIKFSSLHGEELTIKGYELDTFPNFEAYVLPLCFDGDVTLFEKGYIVSNYKGEFFYVDQYQFGEYMNSGALSFCKTLTVWRITDKGTLEILKSATDNDDYYDDDYYDNDYDEGLNAFIPGLVIFGAVLGLLPLAGGIVAFIASSKAKAPYKKYLRTVAIFCLAAAAVTIATVILCVILA